MMSSSEERWQQHLAWLSDKVIGEPREDCARTVAENKRDGFVGVYGKI
jgi:hypothetical protein